MTAAISGNISAATFLIENGAKLDIENKSLEVDASDEEETN